MYAEFLCKSNYSFLEGASHPQELVQEAYDRGLCGLAINDFNGVYGLPKAYWTSKKFSDFKLISGAEVFVENKGSLVLLARDREAYGVLCRMITEAFQGKEKGEAQVSKEVFQDFISSKAGQGLVGLSRPTEQSSWFRECFKENSAQNRFYIPLCYYLDGLDSKRAKEAQDLSEHINAPLIASNDVYYHRRERRKIQDVLKSIQHTCSLDELGYKGFSNSERFIKSPQEMVQLFSDNPQALSRNRELCKSFDFSLSELRYRYPDEWLPKGLDAFRYLEKLTWEGASWRYPSGCPNKVKKQIQHELLLIQELEYADYFLSIYDIVSFARSQKILCQGRGSAANSVICYCLGITAVDPVRMNLLFERFVSAERDEPPDIDVDFEHERREEVIRYIYEKYGRDRAAMVSAVVTYQKRSSYREVCKSFGVEVGTQSYKKLKQKDLGSKKELIEKISEEIEGFPRHLSIHSGGFVLSRDPIIESVPVEPARMEGRTIIQWDKYDLDYLGLLKIDVLSLGMLSALRRCLDDVGLDLAEVPKNDKKTYKMIQEADTVGTFQIESRAQMNMLGRLQPRGFYDLVVQVAIVRPGPIVGQMVHPYLRRRRGDERVFYPHPKVKEILGKTLGVPLFQEQVMRLAIELAGFSPGEADELRRAIGAWRSSGSIEKMGQRLMEGLLKSGLSQKFAEQIFQQIHGFSQYGFPESHAASFALLAYVSAYLKCHHLKEFICALLNAQPMGFYAPHTLVYEAQRKGVKVFSLDLKHSQWESFATEKGIQLGWNLIKGVGREKIEALLLEKEQKPFSDLVDFVKRSKLSRGVLYNLALADAFKCFGYQPREALWAILSFDPQLHKGEFNRISNQRDLSSWKQLNLFSSVESYQEEAQSFQSMSELEAIKFDYESARCSTRRHPIAVMREYLPNPDMDTKRAKCFRAHSRISIGGLILVRQRPSTANGMTFSVLEDEKGFLDLVISPSVFEKFKEAFLHEYFLWVEGRIEKDRKTVSLFVEKMGSFWSH
jgi:error-prone DNA polymerase